MYGVTDEFHQHFVPMRTPDVADWGMDTIGATTGALISLAATLLSLRAGRNPIGRRTSVDAGLSGGGRSHAELAHLDLEVVRVVRHRDGVVQRDLAVLVQAQQ